MKPPYTIERFEHGWTISGIDGRGVPMNALREVLPMIPGANADMDTGIVHHLRETGRPDTIFAIGSPAKLACWRREIWQAVEKLPPEERWWKGFDTGLSSAAIFAVFASSPWREAAAKRSNGATPLDAADFGRCHRLLKLFPEWRARLHQVAEHYPQTEWPRLVAIWPALETATPEKVAEMIRGKECP